jgi:radical SAM protein with 4Fe4S-binding SPASM domain
MTGESYLNEQLKSISGRLNVNDISELNRFPRFFEIGTFTGCRGDCVYCPNEEWTTAKMSDELFSKIASEIGEYSDWVEWVCLSRDGEPLSDIKIEDRVKELKDNGVKYVTFSTHAQYLTENRARRLIEAGLDEIRFSIDGSSKETYEAIRTGLDFDKVTENVRAFLKLRKEIGYRDDKGDLKPKVHIRAVMMDSNRHEEEEWNAYWSARVTDSDIVSSKPPHSWGNQMDSLVKSESFEEYALSPCVSLFGTMIIHPDGKVPLCGIDYNTNIELGDMNKSSIKEIWNSEPYEKVRRLHSTGKRNDIDMCKGCNIWEDVKHFYTIEEDGAI